MLLFDCEVRELTGHGAVLAEDVVYESWVDGTTAEFHWHDGPRTC